MPIIYQYQRGKSFLHGRNTSHRPSLPHSIRPPHSRELTKTGTALARLTVLSVLSAVRRLVLIFVNPLSNAGFRFFRQPLAQIRPALRIHNPARPLRAAAAAVDHICIPPETAPHFVLMPQSPPPAAVARSGHQRRAQQRAQAPRPVMRRHAHRQLFPPAPAQQRRHAIGCRKQKRNRRRPSALHQPALVFR